MCALGAQLFRVNDASSAIEPSEPTVSLFFRGVMMAHILVAEALFEYLAGIGLPA